MGMQRSTIEAYVGIIFGVGYAALTAFGIPVNFWVGVLLWAVVAYCLVDLAWNSPLTKDVAVGYKSLLTVCIGVLTVILIFKGWTNTHQKEGPHPLKRLANVSLDRIGPVENPIIGYKMQLSCTNDSDFPANDAGCIAQVHVVKLKNGSVPEEEQEAAFDHFSNTLRTEPQRTVPKTFEPHHSYLGTDFDTRPAIEGGIDPKNLPNDLMRWKDTILYTGVIFWSDDGGTHRKEFCSWIRATV